MARWQLPTADADSWPATVRADARAIRSHRILLGIGALLVAVATLWSAYSTLHGVTKFVVTLVSAGLGALVLAWAFSWVAAAVIARPRQRREALHQRDRARDTIERMMEGTQLLQEELAQHRNETAVLKNELDTAHRDLKSMEAERDTALEQVKVFNDPARVEGLGVAIDALVKRGFTLYGELDTGPEPLETDEEGRGIAFSFFPPDTKWDPVYAFETEARELLRQYDLGLLFTYAEGVNAARRKHRRRERQRDKAQKKLSKSEQMQYMVDRLHRRPAEELECYVNALVDVKKAL